MWITYQMGKNKKDQPKKEKRDQQLRLLVETFGMMTDKHLLIYALFVVIFTYRSSIAIWICL